MWIAKAYDRHFLGHTKADAFDTLQDWEDEIFGYCLLDEQDVEFEEVP